MLRYAQIQIEGRSVAYASEGNGAPLLLLHGALFDHRIWAPAIPYLSGHFRVIAPDLPGHGRSQPLDGASTPEAQIRQVASLMTHMQIVPCVIAGVGIGGSIAMGVAARYPERIRSVIAIGAAGHEPWPQTSQARLARRLRHIPGMLPSALRLAPGWQARRLLRELLGDQHGASRVLAEQVSDMLRSSAGQRTLLDIIRNLDRWNAIMRQLGGIRAPTLLAWGEHDAAYGLSTAEHLRLAIRNAQLITFAGAGHLLPIEQPIELAALMRQFLLPKQRSV